MEADQVALCDGSALSEVLGNTAQAVDWEQHRCSDGVLCEFRPRAEYKGRPIKPWIAKKAGARFVLRTMWLMGEDDSYPGEYALSTVDSCGGLMKRLALLGWQATMLLCCLTLKISRVGWSAVFRSVYGA
ncbi:hypothetical protein [Candidatus Accumulibacter vicinus]|uniref:Uncharacterized protein n=1 Tax=Candidatus Accumulibacter vicinus TaxID=2954382 RepID=A0A084Y2F7_9PROT|nr:hypothetical protein [Candidatus Accumulibacter vicinus]KFB68901.1 MAG: hypothetical protein CAPSK01_001756 [Candidatus Accumulibacter vicinus]